MAGNARVAQLTEQLIGLLTPSLEKRNKKTQTTSKEHALRTFKSHTYGSTDQFEVIAQFDGLDEKLRVLNADDIAEAINERLDELRSQSWKSSFDILSLLLQLSDQPARHSSLEALEQCAVSEEPSLPTWAEVVADEPLEGGEIWRDIDYEAESSEDGEDAPSLARSPSSPATSLSGQAEDSATSVEAYAVQPDYDAALKSIEAQSWRLESVASHPDNENGSEAVYLTELQCIRETLFMLLGLPTSIYEATADGDLRVRSGVAFKHLNSDALEKVLLSFVVIGNGMKHLRRWAEQEREDTVLQALRTNVHRAIDTFDVELSNYQTHLCNDQGTVVSILAARAKIIDLSKSLQHLWKLLRSIQKDSSPQIYAFEALNVFFDQVCECEAIGDDEVFNFLAKMLFECLRTYLSHIDDWMCGGKLPLKQHGLIIKGDHDTEQSLDSIWQKGYVVSRDAENDVLAPSFIRDLAPGILNAGKCVIFLKHLGTKDPLSGHTMPDFTFENVVESSAMGTLPPFSEKFEYALNIWINARSKPVSQALQERLSSSGQLWECFDAFENLYFLSNGAAADHLVSSISEKMGREDDSWADRYLLTELFQETYGAIMCIDTSRLSIRTNKRSRSDGIQRSVKPLSRIVVEYKLPWHIANIIQSQALKVYQRVFTFLLQIRFAQISLTRRRIEPTGKSIAGLQNESDRYCKLRFSLLWHMEQLYYYLTSVVVSPLLTDMRKKLSQPSDIDSKISIHHAFLQRLEDQCFLSEKLRPIEQAFISLLDLSLLVADTHAAYTGALQLNSDQADRSFVSHPYRRQSHRKSRRDDDSDTDDDGEEHPGNNVSHIGTEDLTYSERLTDLEQHLARTQGFICAGLKGVARANPESSWDILARLLDIVGKPG